MAADLVGMTEGRMYVLAPSARRKSLLDLIEAAQGPLQMGDHPSQPGPVRDALARAEGAVRRVLARVKLGQLQEEHTPG